MGLKKPKFIIELILYTWPRSWRNGGGPRKSSIIVDLVNVSHQCEDSLTNNNAYELCSGCYFCFPSINLHRNPLSHISLRYAKKKSYSSVLLYWYINVTIINRKGQRQLKAFQSLRSQKGDKCILPPYFETVTEWWSHFKRILNLYCQKNFSQEM